MEDPLRVTNRLTHCRLCGEQKNYDEVLDLAGDIKTLLEYLKIIEDLKIDYLDLSESNKLPKTTCEKCYDAFLGSYKFFNNFNQSQIVLNNLFKANMKREPEVGRENDLYSDQESRSDQRVCAETSDDGKPTQSVSNSHRYSYCRFCAKQKNSTDILDISDPEIHKEYLKIVDFFALDYLNLSHFKLPKTSCRTCHQTLNNAYELFKNIKQNQIVLNSLYSISIKIEFNHNIAIKNEEGTIENIDMTSLCGPYEETNIIDDHDQNREPNPLTYCAVSILNEREDRSWNSYTWVCSHCHVEYPRLEELRCHSKNQHNRCSALSCADCDEVFGAFDEFVEHVRRHRDYLRLYCEFCNEKLDDKDQMDEHIGIHCEGTQKICELCGELLPYANTLQWHKKLYGQSMSTEDYTNKHNKSWVDYEWTCQECLLMMPDVESLRYHIQKTHDKCFAMKCMDCSKVTSNYKQFVSHVTGHRPYLRIYCQYCNSGFDDVNCLNQHIIKHITSQQRPCNNCGQIFQDNIQLARHKRLYSEPKHGNPVKRERKKGSAKSRDIGVSAFCRRTSKKREAKLRDTKKIRTKKRSGSLTTEDLTCSICDKLLKSLTTLNRHSKTHDSARPRDFVCPTCGRAFLTKSTMQEHAKTHNSVKTEICQVCKKEFHTKPKLKAHIATHIESKPFVCDECGTSFKTKKRLKCHLISHSDVKPYKCLYCQKDFKFKENLKTHEYQHTGLRPYTCEHCERTFTNWTNCNKHMIRKHGVTLARTKITAQGRVAVNRRTGEPNKLPVDKNAEDWISEMLKPQKRGKKSVS